MSHLLRRTLIGVAFGVLLYVAAILYFEASSLTRSLRGYDWTGVLLALLLSSANYFLRFIKWELCLSWLKVRGEGEHDAKDLSWGRSAQIYLAGLSMSLSPGKVGEVLRSSLLKVSDGVPFSRTAPIVVADRLSDLLALLLLMSIGLTDYVEFLPYAVATIVLILLGVLLLGQPKIFAAILRRAQPLPLLGSLARRAEAMVDSAATVLKPRALLPLTALSVLGWGLECVGYWAILRAFEGASASLWLCTFLWSTTTIVGALSFLPGGLGATEGSLAILIVRMGTGVTQPIALASTLLIRGCTLWYGEVVGAIALAVYSRDPRNAPPKENPDSTPEPASP